MRRNDGKEIVFMERYLSVGNSFLRRQYLPHLLITLIFCSISGYFVSFQNLSPSQAAKAMEMFVAFTGILLFTPLFMPEQNREIWLLEKSKEMSMWKLYLIRIAQAVVILAVIVSIFIWILYLGDSKFSVKNLWWGSISEILFLGAVGFFVSGITNQAVLGYMAAIVYFVVNIGGGKYFGNLALFQMMKGNYDFIPWMAVGAVVLIIAGITIREKMNQ